MSDTQQVHILRLDWPPSLWSLYTIARGRLVPTAKGREYKERVGWAAKAQGARERIVGPVACEVNLYPPADGRRRDGENSEKAIFDAMTGVLYDDDSQIVERHVYTHAPSADPRVEMTVAPLELAGLVLCRVKNLEAAANGLVIDLIAEIKGE